MGVKEVESINNTRSNLNEKSYELRNVNVLSDLEEDLMRWILIEICGKHNHERAVTLIGHPYSGHLKADEKTVVADMTKNNMKPGNILLALKEHDPDNVSIIQTVYK